MSEFKREKRYQVIKLSNPNWKGSCVVVEDDWPEYEIVWKMIQDRVEGKPNIIEQLQSELASVTAGKVTLVKEKFYPADKELIEQLQQQVVMKFSEERVPQFSQGYKSHELLEPVTAEDCAFYVEQVEQLQADNARFLEALQSTVSTLQEYASSNPKHYYREVLQDPNGVHAALAIVNEALAATDSSNWLAEQKAQWLREASSAFKDVDSDSMRLGMFKATAREKLRRMAESTKAETDSLQNPAGKY